MVHLNGNRSSGSAAQSTEAQTAALDARLVLILANRIGDLDALREAIALAKQNR